MITDPRPLLGRIGATMRPIVEPAVARLRRATGGQRPDRALTTSLELQLDTLIGGLVLRTFVLELQVARLRDELRGDDGEVRFDDFLWQLQRGRWRPLVAEYPVLACRLLEVADNWVQATLECLSRYEHDAADLAGAGLIEDPSDRVDSIGESCGDPHRRMRTVRVLSLSSGRRVVYKPRSLRSDVRLQHVLAFLNDRGLRTSFPRMPVVTREQHGWQPFLARTPCADEPGLTRFYRRQGGYLAVLWALQATDIHYANVVAAGEFPYVVDIETLGQPAQRPACGILPSEFSVMDVGFLPKAWRSTSNRWIDVSALGARHLEDDSECGIVAAGTDEMRLVPREETLGFVPSDPGVDSLTVVRHTSDILDGFTEVYDAIRTAGDAALSEGGFALDADDRIRVIVRPTRLYMHLLDNLSHPDMLRDRRDFDRALDDLQAGLERSPHLACLVCSEETDLRRADVPVFSARPDSCSLWDSDGRERPDVLERSSRECIQAGLAAMDDRHLARQRWLIESTLGTLDAQRRRHRYDLPLPATPVPDSTLRQTAIDAADWLLDMAVCVGGGAWWYAIEADRERDRVQPGGAGLYGGTAGIALFLAHCGRLTGDARYTGTASRALTYVERAIDAGLAGEAIGFSGAGGILFALAHLGPVLGRPEALTVGRRLVHAHADTVGTSDSVDIGGGVAGWIKALLAWYASTSDEESLHAAAGAGETLAAHAERLYSKEPSPGLTGYAHGAAGVADALCALHGRVGGDRLLDAAAACLDFERRSWNPATGNWATRRTADPFGDPMVAWCYGAPGILLSRLVTRHFLRPQEAEADIARAIVTTRRQGFGWNHSLCHGDLGNLDCLLTAARARADAELLFDVRRIAGAVCAHIGRTGFLCGLRAPDRQRTFGLMTGVAGVGYAMLRLLDAGTPNVLGLEPPIPAGREAALVDMAVV